MLWLNRLLASPRVNSRPDSFTLTTASKYSTLIHWLRHFARNKQPVVMLCHFPSTFSEVQNVLDQNEQDFEILAETVTRTVLMRRFEGPTLTPQLTMASMLQIGELVPMPRSVGNSLNVALVVLERFPNPARDQEIEAFARNLGCRVQLGYLLSFEDPLLQELLGKPFIELMQQLGLRENDLVSSAMSSRAVSRAIRRRIQNVGKEVPADSPLEWLRANSASRTDV